MASRSAGRFTDGGSVFALLRRDEPAFCVGIIDIDMHYNVIFDISQTQFHHGIYLASGCLFIVVSIGMFWFHQRGIKHTGWRSFAYLVFLALFLCVVSVSPFLMWFGHYHNYLDIKAALQNSTCEVTEGTITNFANDYQSKGQGVGEVFVVDGQHFRYRDGSAQNGFHQTGVIKEGMRVRIYHYDKNDPIDKDIARLEIAQ